MPCDIGKYFADNKPYAGLGRKSLYSGMTVVAARGINIFVQLASTILLAHILSPKDFGLVALVVALVGLAQMLIDFGTTEASAQKTRITQDEISTLFWFNTAIGFSLAVLLCAGSGLVSSIFDEPSLKAIAIVMSFTFILTALSTQYYALMRRAMCFRQIATIDVTSNVIGSIVAVAMAMTGWGYWSLVAKAVVTPALSAAGLWVCCRWVPGRPRYSAEVKELLGFGTGVTGFTVTDYVAKSADRFAIGYFYGAGPLGYFQNAYTIYGNLLSILTEPLHNIAVSGLSKLRHNTEDLKRSWATALSSLSFYSAPAFAMLAVTGQDVVVILLGEKWVAAGPLLCIFAVRGIAHSVERTLGWMHVAAGRSDRWMWWGCFSTVCQIVALIAGLPFGVIGIATSYTIVMYLLFIPTLVYAGRPLGVGTKDVLRTVGPQTAGGLFAAALAFVTQHMLLAEFPQLARILISATICLAAYLIFVVGIFRMTAPLHLAYSLLREVGPARLREGRN